MSATALLKFAQGSHVGNNGRALIVDAGSVVTISNSNNAEVQSYKVELLYAPPDSVLAFTPGLVPPTVLAQGNGVPSVECTPDLAVHGTYRIRLTVWAGANYTGQSDVDIRCFSVPTTNKRFVKPPYQKFPDPLPLAGEGKSGEKPDELNFEDIRLGWSGPEYYTGYYSFRLLNAALEELDSAGEGEDILVTYETDGDVNPFPQGYMQLFYSDGETSGGVWGTLTADNTQYLIEDGAIGLNHLEDGETAGEFLYWTGYAWETTSIPVLPTATYTGQMLYWNANSSSWVSTAEPAANGSLMTYAFNQPGWDLAGTSGLDYVGQMLYWDGFNEHWSVSIQPPSSTVRYVPTMFGYAFSWQTFGGSLPSGTFQGQLLYWDATEGTWQLTYNESADTGMLLALNSVKQPVWVSPGAASLVSGTTAGTVNQYPETGGYLLASDAATSGGIWTRSLNPYVDDGSIDVVKLYGESTYNRILVSYDSYAQWQDYLEDLRTASFYEEYNNGSSGSAKTIDWTVAQKQSVTLTDNCTFTFTAPRGPCNMMLKVLQDSTGGRNIVWPIASRASGGTVLIGQEASKYTLVGIYFDGTNYFLTSSVNITDSQATTVLV